MRTLRMINVVLMVVALSIVAGCGRKDVDEKSAPKTQQTENDAVDPAVVMKELMTKINSLDDKAAIKRLKELIKDDQYTKIKPDLARRLLKMVLDKNGLQTTQDLYLKMSAEDETVARAGYAFVLDASSSTNSVDVVKWYNKILAAPVPAPMKAYTWSLLIRSYGDSDSIMPLVARLDEILRLPQKSQSLHVLSALINQGVSLKDYEGVNNLLDSIKNKAPERKDLSVLALMAEGDLLLKKGMLKEADIFLDTNRNKLGDNGCKRMSMNLLRACIANKNSELAEKLVLSVYSNAETNPLTRNAIAHIWIHNSIESKDVGAFLKRINDALAAGYSKSLMVSVFRDGFYMVMTTGNAEERKVCQNFAESLYDSGELSESGKQTVALLLLDGAFYSSDFKAAYAMIKKGVPGYDKKWHEEMLDKIGAHLALQEGRFEDAIVLFKKHMKRVAAWKEPVINPTNGAKMTREAVLGFNEKRIGDIYSKMDGREKDASAAYHRAREWYKKAIVSLKKGSLEYKLAVEELKKVPGK